MAHLVETMAYAGEVPWHGLGVKVEADMTPDQMMRAAGLDWEVTKQPMMATIDDEGTIVDVPGKKALIRSSDSKVLDIVGDEWNPLQNSDAFKFFEEFCLAGDMEMHTAGSLKEGRHIWVLAKLKESFDILGDDRTDAYLLMSNPHQFGRSIDIRFTPIRVVCNNTLTFSLESASNNFVKMSHRQEFDADVVKEQLGIAHEKFDLYREMATFLSTKRFSAESLVQYYNEIFPRTYKPKEEKEVKYFEDLSKNGQAAYAALETQPGAEFGEGTWWQVLNSVTYLTDHVMGKTADSRLYSSWYGQNQTRKVKAVNKAIEYAEAA